MRNIYVTNNSLRINEIKFNNDIEFNLVNNVFIGGVNDCAKKNKDMVFYAENFCTILDGKIYNYNELRTILSNSGVRLESSSDEELFIKAYSTWGHNAFNKINGVFSVVIYDVLRNEVVCARDRLGVKPLYYEWNKGHFQISSQLKLLIDGKQKLSEEAVSIYLSCGYVPSPYSIFAGINKLQPGHILKLDLNKNLKEIKKYWGLAPTETEDLSYSEAKHKVHEILKDAVKVRIDSGDDFCCFLSGGIDSALITAIASEISDKKIKTFTVGFEDAGYDESKVAQQFSDILDTEHHLEILTKEKFIELLPKFMEAYDEPFADSSALPSLLLNKTTKNHVSTAFAGDGGDESFLGYEHFDSVIKFKGLCKVPYVFRKIASVFFPIGSRFKTILTIKSENEFIERVFLGNQELLDKKQTKWVDRFYAGYKILSQHPLQKAADLNIQLWLENDSNVKVDRASRAYGMKVRSPFLDYRIVELARSLPIEYRFSDGIRKKILRDILETYIPRDVFEQPKKGFSIPLSDWLRTVLKSDLELQLSDDVLRAIPNLNVCEFKKMMSLHFKGEKDYSTFIWRVYVLVLWMNTHKASN